MPENNSKPGTIATEGFRPLHIVPRVRSVPSFSDEEMLRLRQLMSDLETILEKCPMAQRYLSER